jgi:hypothetical protein
MSSLIAKIWYWLIGAEALTKGELIAAKQSTEAAYHRAKNPADKRRLAREIYQLRREIEGMV